MDSYGELCYEVGLDLEPNKYAKLRKQAMLAQEEQNDPMPCALLFVGESDWTAQFQSAFLTCCPSRPDLPEDQRPGDAGEERGVAGHQTSQEDDQTDRGAGQHHQEHWARRSPIRWSRRSGSVRHRLGS